MCSNKIYAKRIIESPPSKCTIMIPLSKLDATYTNTCSLWLLHHLIQDAPPPTPFKLNCDSEHKRKKGKDKYVGVMLAAIILKQDNDNLVSQSLF